MTPTHGGMHFGWFTRPMFQRAFWTALAAVTATTGLATVLIASAPSTECLSLAHVTNGAHLRVTAVPGVDLRPVRGLPGLSATSGPYPGVASSVRRGRTEVSTWIEGRPARSAAVDSPVLLSGSWSRGHGLVVESRLARRLGLRAGRRVHVATMRGPLKMRVTGVAATTSVRRTADAPGLAYVSPRNLRRVAPAPVHGSTLLLRTAGHDSGVLATALQRRYPGPQAVIARAFPDRCIQSPA